MSVVVIRLNGSAVGHGGNTVAFGPLIVGVPCEWCGLPIDTTRPILRIAENAPDGVYVGPLGREANVHAACEAPVRDQWRLWSGPST